MTNQMAFVELVDRMGGDHSVVNNARISCGRFGSAQFTDDGKLSEKDERLIYRLMNGKHGTPFEGAVFQFYVRAPIFVAREWFRHRIGSFNEISGRYKELPTDFYMPKNIRKQVAGSAQMDYKYENLPEEQNLDAQAVIRDVYRAAEEAYLGMIEDGVAKEHARLVLPVGLYTEWVWTVNARALMNFLELRTHPSAQQEIRRCATFIEHLWKQEMPVTHAAFVANGKVAP